MTNITSKYLRSAIAIGAASFIGFASAGDGDNCDALAAQMAAAAKQDPAGVAAMAGASLAGDCGCVLPVANAVFSALGAGSPHIPETVYALSSACPSQAGAIAQSAVAVSPGQESAILDAASRGVEASGTDADGGVGGYGLRPLSTSGIYLIPPSSSTQVGTFERDGDGETTVVIRTTTRTVTRTVVVDGGIVSPVSPSGVGG